MSTKAPDTKKPEYDFVDADGTRYRVWSTSSYEGWTAQIGDLPVEVTEVTRYRDGGTTFVTTTKGRLYFPSHSRHEEPQWRPTRGYRVRLHKSGTTEAKVIIYERALRAIAEWDESASDVARVALEEAGAKDRG